MPPPACPRPGRHIAPHKACRARQTTACAMARWPATRSARGAECDATVKQRPFLLRRMEEYAERVTGSRSRGRPYGLDDGERGKMRSDGGIHFTRSPYHENFAPNVTILA